MGVCTKRQFQGLYLLNYNVVGHPGLIAAVSSAVKASQLKNRLKRSCQRFAKQGHGEACACGADLLCSKQQNWRDERATSADPCGLKTLMIAQIPMLALLDVLYAYMDDQQQMVHTGQQECKMVCILIPGMTSPLDCMTLHDQFVSAYSHLHVNIVCV